VPRVAEPPLVPLTAQVTPVFEVPETAAVNWNASPARMFADPGETVTETEAGVVGAAGEDELFEDVEVAAQPAKATAASNETAWTVERNTTKTHLGKGMTGAILGWLPLPGLLDEREEEGQRPSGGG
jgi:hypothetical protein